MRIWKLYNNSTNKDFTNEMRRYTFAHKIRIKHFTNKHTHNNVTNRNAHKDLTSTILIKRSQIKCK